MSDELNNNPSNEEQCEILDTPAKIERVLSSDIEAEKKREEKEQNDELVRKIMKQILDIK